MYISTDTIKALDKTQYLFNNKVGIMTSSQGIYENPTANNPAKWWKDKILHHQNKMMPTFTAFIQYNA